MAWQDRLQPNIIMESPEGNEFSPKWRGNDRSGAKKLGLYDYPDVIGTVAQDLNSKSRQYPLTVFFDGENYDLEADSFFTACEEVGLWSIEHPVYGPLLLQMTTYSQAVNPVKEGGVATFNLGFFEPATDEIIESISQLQSDVVSQVELSNINAIEAFSEKLENATVAATTEIKSITGKVTDAIELVLGPIVKLNNGLNSIFNAILRGIDDILDAAILDPLQLAGQITNLIQVSTELDITSQLKLNRYKTLADEIFGITSDDSQALFVKELALGSVNSSYSLMASTTDARSRPEIIEQILTVGVLFEDVIKNLEADQSKFLNDPITTQYIALQDSFSDYWITSTKAIRAMLKSALGLAIEKRFTLIKNTHPLSLVISEYGDDTKLDFFYETNDIGQFEFLLLSPGREVVIFQEVA